MSHRALSRDEVERIEELQDEMMERMEEIRQLYRPTSEYDRFMAYPFGQITGHFPGNMYVSVSMMPLYKLTEKLRAQMEEEELEEESDDVADALQDSEAPASAVAEFKKEESE